MTGPLPCKTKIKIGRNFEFGKECPTNYSLQAAQFKF
jgi:hypothetical protein